MCTHLQPQSLQSSRIASQQKDGQRKPMGLETQAKELGGRGRPRNERHHAPSGKNTGCVKICSDMHVAGMQALPSASSGSPQRR
jgi:hypothetical protein